MEDKKYALILKEIHDFFSDDRKENIVCNIISEIEVKGFFLQLDCLNIPKYDMRMVDFALIQVKNMLKWKYNIKAEFLARINIKQKVLYMKERNHKKIINYIIPYENREEYIEFINI